VQSITHSINVSKEATLQITAFSPRNPQDVYAAGFALFIYDATWDAWRGYWRDKTALSGTMKEPEFSVTEWRGIPWHEVKFTDPYWSMYAYTRAVSLDYCRGQLRIDQESTRIVIA
jgi:hypothetical protein